MLGRASEAGPEPTALLGEDPGRYGLDLAGCGDGLSSNPDTSYGGGRFGRRRLDPPPIDDLLHDVEACYGEFLEGTLRAERAAEWEALAGDGDLEGRRFELAPGVGWLPGPPSGPRRLARYLDRQTTELPPAAAHVVHRISAGATLGEVARDAAEGGEAVVSWTRDLHVLGYLRPAVTRRDLTAAGAAGRGMGAP